MMFGVFLISLLLYNVTNEKRIFYIMFPTSAWYIVKLTVDIKEKFSPNKHLLEFEFIRLFDKDILHKNNVLFNHLKNNKNSIPIFSKINKRNYSISKGISKIEFRVPSVMYISYIGYSENKNVHETSSENRCCFLVLNIGKDKIDIKIKERLSLKLFVTETEYLREFEELFDLELKKVPTPSNWLNISTRAKRRGYSFLWSTVGLLSGTIISTFIGFMRQSNIWRF